MWTALALALALGASAPAPRPVDAAAPNDASAPADDYGFVAWCEGALGGHMALYEIVRPQLDDKARKDGDATDLKETARMDAERMSAGVEYLALYARALKRDDARTHRAHAAEADRDRAMGQAIWTAARQADPTTRMWSWLMWELPARCETAAHRLEMPASRKSAH